MEKLTFDTDEGKKDFYILASTRVAGNDYILLSENDNDDEEGYEVFIMKDVSKDSDTEAVYEFIEDENELDAVYQVFLNEME